MNYQEVDPTSNEKQGLCYDLMMFPTKLSDLLERRFSVRPRIQQESNRIYASALKA
jgi:hypothetical protein